MLRLILLLIISLITFSCTTTSDKVIKAEDISAKLGNKTIVMIQEDGVKDAAFLSENNYFLHAKNSKLPVVVKKWSTDKGALCIGDDCYKIYEQAPHLYLRAVNKENPNIHITKILNGDPLNLVKSIKKKKK